ncbi:MAG: sugar kinase [Spirochaetes bacterium]|nr:sugar kinase [Spirochaetota bacterium]
MALTIKPKNKCRWDEASLGEVMIRLDPGDTRIKTAREFKVWEGGGEYNVARGLRRCFNLTTTVVTAIPENDVGYLLQDLILQGGVDTSHIRWVKFDGVGRNTRVGLNFTERGYGIRAALGVSDRGNSASSQLKVGDIDWNTLFKEEGVRWFHCGGIYAALSATTADVTIEAMKAAKANGTIVSYDLNYRDSLWKSIGGKEKAQAVNREIAKYVDVMIGNEEDFTAALGFAVEGVDENITGLDPANFKKMIEKAVAAFPNFKAVATTLREVKTASVNDWGAVLWYDGKFFESRKYPDLEIYDRVGGGDSFASGLAYGFLAGKDAQYAVDCGAAHGALAMTTPGDTSMAWITEVEKTMKGGSARVQR